MRLLPSRGMRRYLLLSLPVLKKLKQQYEHAAAAGIHACLGDVQSFETEVASLLHRYKYGYQQANSKYTVYEYMTDTSMPYLYQ